MQDVSRGAGVLRSRSRPRCARRTGNLHRLSTRAWGFSMVRADRIALGVGSLVGGAAVGLVGLMLAVGAFVPPNEPACRAQSVPGDPAPTAISVTLRIPEGEPAAHVRVVDASGHELATVTRWYNGD